MQLGKIILQGCVGILPRCICRHAVVCWPAAMLSFAAMLVCGVVCCDVTCGALVRCLPACACCGDHRLSRRGAAGDQHTGAHPPHASSTAPYAPEVQFCRCTTMRVTLLQQLWHSGSLITTKRALPPEELPQQSQQGSRIAKGFLLQQQALPLWRPCCSACGMWSGTGLCFCSAWLTSAVIIAPAALVDTCPPLCTCRGKGRLVVVSSMAAKVPSPGQAVYSAAKMGVWGYFASLSTELADK